MVNLIFQDLVSEEYFESAEDLVVGRREALELVLELEVFGEQGAVERAEEFAAVLAIG